LTKRVTKILFSVYIIKKTGATLLETTILDRKSDFGITSKSAFSKDNETFSSCSFASMLERHKTPGSHRTIADNYIIIKKIYKFQSVMQRITSSERAILTKYNFKTLEYTTKEDMYRELELLRNWSLSENEALKNDSDSILRIRAKELKFLDSLGYAVVSSEINQGYSVLANYFVEISKYPVARF
jgi:hypothetical protein